MASNYPYKPNDKPVPGYRLQERLGKGTVGEVWLAKGPGGKNIALKVIPDLSSSQALKELRALEIVKNLSHPNLVPIHAFWLKDGGGGIIDDSAVVGSPKERLEYPATCELIIAMGLGDKTLYDRLQECNKAAEQTGIPSPELLDYMEEAAKAIDYLNFDETKNGVHRAGVQHCDIKPFNILITGSSAQVCDFGLARVQGAVRATASLSGTVAYAAPECLENAGDPSTTTDQYSLAITYYELRTGVLPFPKESFVAVMQASLAGKLDLSKVNYAEETVLRRATARQPGNRYPSAGAMVKALRSAVEQPHKATVVIEPPVNEPQPGTVAIEPSVEKSPLRALSAGGALLIFLGLLGTAYQMGLFGTVNSDSHLEKTSNTDLSQKSSVPTIEALLQQADVTASRGDLTAAIRLYSDAIKLDKEKAEAYLGRAKAHAKADQADEAIDDFQQVRVLDADNRLSWSENQVAADIYLKRAERRRNESKFDAAANDCNTVIRHYKRWAADAHCEWGAIERDRKNYARAIEELNAAIALEPGNALAYSRRGDAYLRTKDYERALPDLNRALELDPNDTDLFNRAAVYSATGKLPEALTQLNALLEKNPDDGDCLYQRGVVNMDLRHYSAAIFDLRKALQHLSDKADAQAELGWLLACAPGMTEGNAKEALDLTNKACETTERQDPRHLDCLAAALARAGDYPRAIQTVQEALALSQDSSAEGRYQERLALYQDGQPYFLPQSE